MELYNIHISIHKPTPYVENNIRDFLPHWQKPPLSVVIVLQKAQIDLRENNDNVAQEKNRLRAKFLNFGRNLTKVMSQQNFLTEVIDPRTGIPFCTSKATQTHDDAQVVCELLNLPLEYHNGCKLIKHPQWHTANYPSVLMSSASHEVIEAVISLIVIQQGWQIT